MKTLHAFYSAKQATICGTVIYRGLDGTEVECTEVSEFNTSGAHFDDIKYLGEVVHYCEHGFIRRGLSRIQIKPCSQYRSYNDRRYYR